MASKKHKDAKKKRDIHKSARDTAVSKMKSITNKKSAEWKAARNAVIRASSKVREQGDIMRGETGREKGEKTSYTGPLKTATIDAIKALQVAEPDMYVGSSLTETDWMKANENLLNKYSGTYAEQRRAWEDDWANDRESMLQKQRDEYNRITGGDEEVVIDTDTGVTDESLSLLGGVGNVITGLYDNPVVQQQRYLSPAAQDWSAYMPAEGLLQSPAQQRLAAQGGLLYQPGSRPVQSRYVGALSEYNLPQGLGTHQVSYMGLPKFGTTDNGTTDNGTTDNGTTDNGDDVYIPPPGGGNGGNGGNGGGYVPPIPYDVVGEGMEPWVHATGPEPDYGDVFNVVGGNPHADISNAFTHTPVIPDISGLLDTQSPLLYSYDPNVSASYSGMLDDFSVDDFIDTTTTSVNPHF